MTEFTPIEALVGGMLIGLSALAAMGLFGRIAGISGILGGLIAPGIGDRLWRFSFLLGLVAAPLGYWAISGEKPSVVMPSPTGLVIIGGLLVGAGTALGSGCTSGHGVCGMARLSRRSLVATLCFMGTGFLTVFILRHGLGVW